MADQLSVLSYNISWEATHSGSPQTAKYKSNIRDLGNYCHTDDNCLYTIIDYLETIINDQNGIDFILLQETGNDSYKTLRDELNFNGVNHSRKKCAILYRTTYRKEPSRKSVEISGNFGCSQAGEKIPKNPSKQLKGRPILINFFHKNDELFVIVNVHAPHGYSEQDIQNDISWLLSSQNNKDIRKIQNVMDKPWRDISIVVGGDFNQVINNLHITINDTYQYPVTVKQIPDTCCDGNEINNPDRRSFNRGGDIILTNRVPSYKPSSNQYSDLFVPKGAYGFIASDHLPVRSITISQNIYSHQPQQGQYQPQQAQYQPLQGQYQPQQGQYQPQQGQYQPQAQDHQGELNYAFETLIRILRKIRPKKLRNKIISLFKVFINNQQKLDRLDQLSQSGGGNYISKSKKKYKKMKKTKKKKKSLKKSRVISDKKYKEYIQKKKTKKKLTKKQNKDLDKILFVKYCKCIKTLKNNKKIKKNLEYPICMSSVYSKRGFKAPKNVKKKCKQYTY